MNQKWAMPKVKVHGEHRGHRGAWVQDVLASKCGFPHFTVNVLDVIEFVGFDEEIEPVSPWVHFKGIGIRSTHMEHALQGWPVHEHGYGVRLVQRRQTLEEKFGRLVKQWREETDLLSSPSGITSSQAYLGIIALGQPVVPLILTELREHGGFWYPALRALTGTDPIPPSARGKPKLMREAWVEWGKQYELID